MSASDPQQARPPRAIALHWDPGAQEVPDVVARGRGELARRILELARAHDVPVREDEDLVELLAACDVGDEVPPELYRAVAELLAWLYRQNDSLCGPPAHIASASTAKPPP